MPSLRHSEECEARRENLTNNNYKNKNKNQNNMEKTLNLETYESPNTEVFTIETEGAILTDSLNGVGHNPYTNGDDIDF